MLEPGDIIDIWVVEKQLGSGGMGSVYRCHNRDASRIMAAVKVLDLSGPRSPGAQERFIREAEILFGLDHPNIVKVRNVRTDHTPPYLEMEFIRGESLEDALQRGPLPYGDALHYTLQLTEALAHLHRSGIRHRDLKPANVLIREDGRLKLVDFGLAMESNATRITQAGMTFGTVSYAPPEWVNPEKLDPVLWDLYALGVCIWEMFTGQVAFPQSDQGSARQQAMQVILAKQSHPPLDPGDACPPELRRLIAALTQADPDKRARDTQAVAEAARAIWIEAIKSGAVEPPAAADAPTGEHDTESALLRVETTSQRPAGPATWAPGPQDTDDSPLPATSRPSPNSSGSQNLAMAAGAGLGALILLGGIGSSLLVAAFMLGAFDFSRPPAPRAVDVLVAGLPAQTPVQVQIAGRPPREVDGFSLHFDPQEPADAQLRWVVGQDCHLDTCPGETCPAWCTHGESHIAVPPGDGVHTVPLSLALPPARSVRFSASALAESTPRSFRVGNQLAELGEDKVATLELAPGEYSVVASAGSCSEADDNCQSGGTCPPGCSSLHQVFVLPVGDAPLDLAVDLSEPAPVERVQRPRPQRPVAAPSGPASPPAAPPPSPGGAVTYSAFARWVAKNPDWSATSARGTDRADQHYLMDWSGDSPPAGSAGSPIVNVSWYAASAYCRSRGGLAEVDGEPLTWPQSHPLEWRTASGKPAWRSKDGQQSTRIRMQESNAMTSFRCAR